MALTYSISTGIAVGFIVYPILMVAARRQKEISIMTWVLLAVSFLYFAK
jgi:AGZA family xanthine/uracil permease-like MFS transporter